MNPDFLVNIQPGASGDTEMFDFDFDSAMSTANSPGFHPTNSNGSSNDIPSYDFDLNKNNHISMSSTAAPIDIAYQKNPGFGFRNQLPNNNNQNINNVSNTTGNNNNSNINNTPSNNNTNNTINTNNTNNNTTSNIINNISNQNISQFLNNPRLRRESIAHTQGMGGVSFGSLTIGSWLKDEVLFHHNGIVGNNSNNNNGNNNNSNNPNQSHHAHSNSQNFHNQNHSNNNFSVLNGGGSSSAFNPTHHHNNSSGMLNINNDLMMTMSPPQVNYLPNLEADYCKDYSCCGNLLPTLHDLLRHYEEAHISVSPPSELVANSGRNNGRPGKIRSTLDLMEGVSTNEVFLSSNDAIANNLHADNGTNNNNNSNMNGGNIANGSLIDAAHHQQNQNSQLGDITNNGANNDTLFNFNNHLGGVLSNFNATAGGNDGFSDNHNNNNLNNTSNATNVLLNKDGSSSNTSFGTARSNLQSGNFNSVSPQLQNKSPHTSNLSANLQQQQQQQHQQQHPQHQQNGHHQQGNTNFVNSSNGPSHGNNPSGNSGEDEEICIDDPARHLYVDGENRPFKCPVIGCDKTYKNQNGLKYHKAHGHQNQKLLENPDGTFSVIDPESNQPYPDGNFNLEKDKPYRCEVCGKRYKNLNGLKYHRGHSTH